MSRSSIEERIAGLVADKRALFKGVFEGVTDDLRFDGGSAISSLLETLATPDDVAGSSTATVDEPGGDDAEVPEPGTFAGEGTVVPTPSLAPVGLDSVSTLFGAIAVQRRADGGLVIEAPPQTARALQSLFEGMARLMAIAAEGGGADAGDAALRPGELE